MSPSDSTNLTRDGGPAKMDTYFASPELSQRADLLRHLTENSNLIPLVRGAEGMGKTTFVKHLLELAPENWIPVEVCADVMLQPDALLAYLADLFDQNDNRSDGLMVDLTRHFDALRQDGLLPVIIVDDAHLLPEASIITLLRLHEQGHNDAPLVQILLFAEPDIDDLLKTSQLRVMNLQSLQLLDMPEFTLEQTELYLEHLFPSEESSIITPLTISQIEKIHYETGGSPGLIKEQVKELFSLAQKPLKTTKQYDYFSTKNMFGAGLVVAIVIPVLIFQNNINAIFSGDAEPVAVTHKDKPTAGDTVYLPIPDFVDAASLEQDMAEDTPGKQAAQGEMEIAAGIDEDLGPVSAEQAEVIAESVDLPPQQEMVKDRSEPEPATMLQQDTSGSEKKNDVVTQPPVEKKVTRPDKVLSNKEQKRETEKRDAKASKAAPKVIAAKVEKPQQVKKAEKLVEVKKEVKKPPVKTVEKIPAPAIKEPPKSAQISPPPAQKKGVPVPAPVDDRSTMLAKRDVPSVKVTETRVPTAVIKATAVSPKVTPSGFLREEWLVKQAPSNYTIQLVGLQDEKGIAEFIRRYSVSGHIAYYRTQRNGKPWFSVLYGSYSTRNRAVEARNKLPDSLIKTGVWMRTLDSVQKDIRAE